MKNLVGKHVSAIGSCGQFKNQKVFGILDNIGFDWIVTIIDEDGGEMLCSVYFQSIVEA